MTDAARPLPVPKTILVPVDFSECSRAALRQAVELATVVGAEIDVLHVVAAPPYVPLDLAIWGEVRPDLSSRLTPELRAFVADAVGDCRVEVSTRVETGVPYDAILTASESADWIVMGTHGRTAIPRFLMGSVAERVVRAARCPVLTVRGEAPDRRDPPDAG